MRGKVRRRIPKMKAYKNIFFSFFLFFALSMGIVLLTNKLHPKTHVLAADASPTVIKISDTGYTPSEVTVHVGDTVRWTNTSSTVHTATSIDGVWDTDSLTQGKSYDFQFTQPGKYNYHCSFHSNMKGTITVLADETATTAPTGTTVTDAPTGDSPGNTTNPTTIPTPVINPGDTVLSLTLFLDGVGEAGDRANPSNATLSNKEPHKPQREVTAFVLDSNKQVVANGAGVVSYASASGNFEGLVGIGQSLVSGDYSIQVKTDRYLQSTASGTATITQGQTNTIPPITLVAGDVNSDNKLDILDYNTLLDCYSDMLPSKNCSDTTKVTDLNDDGKVNAVDVNLFLREFSVNE